VYPLQAPESRNRLRENNVSRFQGKNLSLSFSRDSAAVRCPEQTGIRQEAVKLFLPSRRSGLSFPFEVIIRRTSTPAVERPSELGGEGLEGSAEGRADIRRQPQHDGGGSLVPPRPFRQYSA
jgi:hypothetical protein